MKKEFLNPPELSRLPGLTQVVTAVGGKLVYVSGQVALNADGQLVGRGDLRAQAVQVFENLTAALAGAGATIEDVVKTNIYVVDYTAELLATIREVRGRFLPAEHPPASTLVGVQALALEGLLIEIEAMAVVKE